MADRSTNEPLKRAGKLLALGVVLLVAILWWQRQSSTSGAGASGAAGASQGGSAGSGAGAPAFGAGANGAEGSGGGAANGGGAGAAPLPSSSADLEAARRAQMKLRRWKMVGDALELNRFPPDSQPLTPAMTDVLKPYSRHETPVAIPRKKDGKIDPETSPYVLFTGPKYLLSPGTPIEAHLEVFARRPKEGEPPERMEVDIADARLLKFGQPQFTTVVKAPLNDAGNNGDPVAGDRVYSVTIPASALESLATYNGMLQLTADVRLNGVDGISHLTLDFMMTAAPPAVFTDNVRERLAPQGLELTVRVDVKQKGNYFTQALLFDSKNKPIGYAVSRNAWDVGPREATFLFFGLLFHDANAQGPYVMRTLTGARLAEGNEPFNTEMPPYAGEYWTKNYPLSDFSTNEYESPNKDKLIQGLTELAEKNPEKTVVPSASGSAMPAGSAKSAKP